MLTFNFTVDKYLHCREHTPTKMSKFLNVYVDPSNNLFIFLSTCQNLSFSYVCLVVVHINTSGMLNPHRNLRNLFGWRYSHTIFRPLQVF